jgi:ABC-2 type transport system permease protein
VAKADPGIPNSMFVTQFSTIFAGMTLVTTVCTLIAEDKEKKSLRFLIMAGVKPQEYLLGIGSVVVLAGMMVTRSWR